MSSTVTYPHPPNDLLARWQVAKNIGEASLEPYQVVEITGVEEVAFNDGPVVGTVPVLTVQGVSSAEPSSVAVVGKVTIPSGNKFGYVTMDFPCYVLVNGTVAVGDTLGPVENESYAEVGAGSEVFRALSGPITVGSKSICYVDKLGGGGGANHFRAVMLGGWTAAGSGFKASCSIWGLNGGSYVNLSITADVYDPDGIYNILTTGASLFGVFKQGEFYYVPGNAKCTAGGSS